MSCAQADDIAPLGLKTGLSSLVYYLVILQALEGLKSFIFDFNNSSLIRNISRHFSLGHFPSTDST